MVRVSASILGFLFEARAKKITDEIMIEHINKALREKKELYDILHLDIEDGKFVNNKSFTPAQIRRIKSPYKSEAHFMVVDYDNYIADYYGLADMFIVHNEVIKSTFQNTIDYLHKNKKFVGISINPDTSIDTIKYLDKVDLILVMSVHPGLPGQKFIEHTFRKIRKLNELRKKHKYHYKIEVDGGIDNSIAQKCAKEGADIVVMGSHLFN